MERRSALLAIVRVVEATDVSGMPRLSMVQATASTAVTYQNEEASKALMALRIATCAQSPLD
jgi:hypothetical protein